MISLKTLKRLPLSQKLIVTGVMVGMASGLSSFLFTKLIDFFGRSFDIVRAWPARWEILALAGLPALGGLIAGWLCHRYCPDAKGSGVTNVITAIEERSGLIRGRVAWVTALASAATLGLGGSTGKEGPVIQIGAAIGSKIGQVLEASESNLKMLAASGAVGGLSAAFGIPLAGVFFTMEVILGDFAHEAFSAVVISSVTATITARLLLGKEGFFTPVLYRWQRPSEFLLYALLGIFCAFIGILYQKSLSIFTGLFQRERAPDWVKPVLGGFLVGCLGLFLPNVLGEGHAIVNNILTGQSLGWIVLLLIFGKMLATALTLGSGGAGGNLMPALFIGAMTGGAWGEALRFLGFHQIQMGAYAIVGMACVFTASFQAPMSGIILAFELTRDYGILMPVMFACTLAFIFSRERAKAH